MPYLDSPCRELSVRGLETVVAVLIHLRINFLCVYLEEHPAVAKIGSQVVLSEFIQMIFYLN